MRVELTPAAAAYAARELERRPELNHTLTVEAFLVAGCCSPNLPPEVHLGPPPSGDFRAVTVPLAVPGGTPGRGAPGHGAPGDAAGDGTGRAPRAEGGGGATATAGATGTAGPEASLPAGGTPAAAEVYVDPLVEDFVRDWYGEEGREQARQTVLRIDLVRYGDREELTVRPWPPQPAAPDAGWDKT